MKNQNVFSRKLINSMLSKRPGQIAAVVLGVLGVAGAQTFNPQPDLPSFGLVGINPDVESLLLNVSNVAIPGVTARGACDVQLSFSDINGNILQSIVVPQLAVGSSSSSQLVFTTPPRGGSRCCRTRREAALAS